MKEWNNLTDDERKEARGGLSRYEQCRIMDECHKMRALYFEGAGWSGADISKATVGNCRIRTAFHLDNGQPVYMEIIGDERTRHSIEDIYKWRYTGFVTDCFGITDDVPNDDCNNHRIKVGVRSFEYSEAGILGVVNGLGASFDAIKVLPDLGGYRVFPENGCCEGTAGYFYGDEFEYDPELVARREAVHNRVYEIEKAEMVHDLETKGGRFEHSPNGVYPNFSLWVDEKDPGQLHLLRRYRGFNKHWTIRVDTGDTLDDWMATMTETLLGKCGC